MAASQSWERQLHGSQRFYRSSPRLRLRSRVLALFMELRGQPGNMAVWDRGDSNQTPSPQLRRLLTYSFVCFPLVRMRLNYVMLVHSDMFIGGWPISHGDFGQKWNRSWNVYIDNIALFCPIFSSSSEATEVVHIHTTVSRVSRPSQVSIALSGGLNKKKVSRPTQVSKSLWWHSLNQITLSFRPITLHLQCFIR